jgi:hypothetical protein
MPSTLSPAQKRAVAPPEGERVPGNFYLFELFIVITLDGIEYFGLPKQAIRDTGKSPPILRWGSRADLSTYANPAIPRAPWKDDPTNGVATRPRNAPEDWLGAEGIVGDDTKFVIDGILQKGKNEVVYSLFNPKMGIRTAYGFSLKIFGSKAS